MKATDLRDATWKQVLTHITEDMVKVHLAWQAHGPGTTRQIAQLSEISILTFRPRTTDLMKLGLVILVDNEGNEGIYAYRSREDAEVSCTWQRDGDFRNGKAIASEPERIGFVTVEEAINSLPAAERGALGARLMSLYGHHLKKREAGGGAEQMSLLTA